MRTMTEMSKLIALVLRHKPWALGLTLDEHGWCETEALIGKLNEIQPFGMEELCRIVAEDGKQRYAFSGDRRLIRANQGHSIPVDVELPEAIPPETLYHGTAERFVSSILREGIDRRARLYVHLSANADTAVQIGSRHGRPAVLVIDARRMAKDGHRFYLSVNGVWLVKAVPPQYLTLLPSGSEK